jgi:hypothetical protein
MSECGGHRLRDGEQAIAEIAAGRPWSEIAGLMFRDDKGQISHNPPRMNAPLDDDLLPARDCAGVRIT